MNVKNGQETLIGALAALRDGRLDEAERLCLKLLDASPDDPGVHMLAATLALQRENYADADRWARACLALHPGHGPALSIAGRAARAMGDHARALDCFRKAAELSPERPEPFFQLCVTQLESKDPAAQPTLEHLLRRFPKAAEGWHQIGQALHRANQLEGAAVAFSRAAQASGSALSYLSLGHVLLALDRPEEAVTALRQSLTQAPGLVEPLLPLAQALRRVGAAEEARQHLERRAGLNPDSAHVCYTLALVCEDLHDGPAAIAAYRRCLALEPDLAEAHVNLGLALQDSGDMDLAKQSYREAMRLRPDTFGRIAQALPSTRKGQLWLNVRALRRSLGG